MQTVSRHEASEAKQLRYFTGLPCGKGHLAERRTSNGKCTECTRLEMSKSYKKDPKATHRATSEWLKKRREDPEWAEAHRIKRNSMRRLRLERQAGRKMSEHCEVCGAAGESHSLGIVYDHCHATNLFRGWLCGHCNSALGHAKDDPALLRKLADYLEKANEEF